MSDDELKNSATVPPVGDVQPPPIIPRSRRARKLNGATPPPSDEFEPYEVKLGSGPDGEVTSEDLDEDERKFARLRRDLPNVGGSAAIGIMSIGVSKAPPKNEFFRVKKGFRPVIDIVVDEVGMDQKFLAVDPDMAEPLRSIGIAFAPHVLYLIITPKGAFRIIPVRCPDVDGSRNDYASTKELALRQAEDEWVRIYTDRENACYRSYPAHPGRFPNPVWPDLSAAKIFRLCFEDRGCLIESPDHPRFAEWAALQIDDHA
jgi:hypothetical protein